MRKLKAIWHILTADRFLCFTYKECCSCNSEYMEADRIYVDKRGLSKYFFDSINTDYESLKKRYEKDIF